jgi:hypothetical protein
MSGLEPFVQLVAAVAMTVGFCTLFLAGPSAGPGDSGA